MGCTPSSQQRPSKISPGLNPLEGGDSKQIAESIPEELSREELDLSSNIAEIWEEKSSFIPSDSWITVAKDLGENVAYQAATQLFNLAGGIPFVGPISTNLLQFYDAYNASEENRSKFEDLKKNIDAAAELLNDIATDVVKLKQSDPNGVGKKIFNRVVDLNKCICESAEFMSLFSKSTSLAMSSFKRLNQMFNATNHSKKLNRLEVKMIDAKCNLSIAVVPLVVSNNRKEMDPDLERNLDTPFHHFDSDIEVHLKNFRNGSRQWMHEKVDEWVKDTSDQSKVFWVKAEAGLGKSAFTASVIRKYQEKRRCLALFFCRYGEVARSNANNIIKSLAFQIAENRPETRGSIANFSKTLKSSNTPFSINQLFEELAIKPLRECPEPNETMVLFLDALDEIENESSSNSREQFLTTMANNFQRLPKWVKIFITSRPEKDIVSKLSIFQPTLIESEDPRHRDDLRDFITSKLQGRLSNENDLNSAVDLVLQKSEGKFVYMAIISSSFDSPVSSADSWTLESLKTHFPDGVYDCYRREFDRICAEGSKSRKTRKQQAYFNDWLQPLLKKIVVAQEPLEFSEVMRLLKISRERLEPIAHKITSMFPLRGTSEAIDGKKFYFFHKSVTDWLTDRGKSGNTVIVIQGLEGIESEEQDESKVDYFLDVVECHKQFASKLIEQIDGYMHEDWSQWGFSRSGPYLSTHLLDHLDRGHGHLELSRRLLTRLPWLIEVVRRNGVLALSTYLRQRVAAASSSSTASDEDSNDFNLVYKAVKLSLTLLLTVEDSERAVDALVLQLIGRLRGLAERRRSQTSSTSLRSLVRECFDWWHRNKTVFPEMFHITPPGGPLEVTFLGHSGNVNALCVLKNGQIASGGDCIKIWNPVTLDCDKTIRENVSSLDSLPDGKLVSISPGGKVSVWAYPSWDCSASFQTDERKRGLHMLKSYIGNRVVVASEQKLDVWNLDEEKSEHCLLDKSYAASTDVTLNFDVFPDGRIAFATVPSTNDDNFGIKIWKPRSKESSGDGSEIELVLKGCHTKEICSIIVWKDKLVSASRDLGLKIWSLKDGGSVLREFSGHTSYQRCLRLYSSKGDNYLIAGSWDERLVRVWNLDTGDCERSMSGHAFGIRSVACMSDGRIVSGSEDRSVNMWDPSIGDCEIEVQRHTSWVTSISFMADGRILSGAYDKLLMIWDTFRAHCECSLVANETDHYCAHVEADAYMDGTIASNSQGVAKVFVPSPKVEGSTGLVQYMEEPEMTPDMIKSEVTPSTQHSKYGSSKVLNLIKSFAIQDIYSVYESDDGRFGIGTESGFVFLFVPVQKIDIKAYIGDA